MHTYICIVYGHSSVVPVFGAGTNIISVSALFWNNISSRYVLFVCVLIHKQVVGNVTQMYADYVLNVVKT